MNLDQKSGLRSGSISPFVIIGIVAVGLVGFAIYYAVSMRDSKVEIAPITAEVTRGEFVSQVIDQGEVQSSSNVEIRCEATSRSGSLTVLEVCPEGKVVKPGDFLVQLDATGFEKELEQQNIAVVNAKTRVIQAESTLESAKATKREYIEGTFEEEKLGILNDIKDAEGLIATAQQREKQAMDTLAHSRKLQAKGFITAQALESAGFDLEKAQIELRQGENSLELAKKRLWVLEEITKEKNVIQFDADIKAAEVQLDSERKALVVEEETQREVQEMIDKCRITVPENVSGQVVYAKESSRGGNDWILEEGTTVRQNQVLIRLPDPTQMEVKALINEQSITQIEENMPCTIKVDALNDVTLKGIVTKVNQYAESSGWMSSSVRKYAVLVSIFDPPAALKPGMNAAVTIETQYEPDVLMAPIQSVYAVQDKKFCLVKRGDSWETVEVEIGGDNSQVVYFTSGVEQGDVLVMNPGAYKDELGMELPEIDLETRIELPENAEDLANQARQSRQSRGSGNGGASREIPASGSELIASKDTDGDGKLSKDEAGTPYTMFFDRLDGDGDGLVDESEADAAIEMMKRMRERMQQNGGPGGPGGRAGGPGGGPGGPGGRAGGRPEGGPGGGGPGGRPGGGGGPGGSEE